jgi:hypothetical protein
MVNVADATRLRAEQDRVAGYPMTAAFLFRVAAGQYLKSSSYSDYTDCWKQWELLTLIPAHLSVINDRQPATLNMAAAA